MKFQDLPDYDSWRAWKTAEGKWEVKLEGPMGGIELHLSEDEDAEEDRIESGKFYLNIEGVPTDLTWIRERKGIEMPNGMDADYVEISKDGKKRETQHNHIHLDRDVDTGRRVALTPV